ncbi:uncharacterized protein LOC126744223 [Anthonomus grandis grandis]|uniref:uncharacterized protein LOC126744223 n=1 Tax=Anthonomus grandis grandis TaxID=2921223 RepID=UPI002165EA1A|nr:uncharacterized protein LOC126744223 [Anthonomus grandis grandis]
MNCFNDKIKLNAFEEKTTYQNDFKKYCDRKKENLKNPRIRAEQPIKPPPKRHYTDNETFTTWKDDVYIPFDLLLFPKPIVQTDPRKPFEKLAPLPEVDKLEAQKTRPRIYMTPACSLDDVPDPEMRRLLCQFVYTSEWRNAEIEGASGFKPKIPNFSKIETRDLVSLQTDLYPPLEERFIKEGKPWDDQQRRGSSDPTAQFWINKDPPVLCGACVDPLKNLVSEETKEEIAKAVGEERLRLAHDMPSPSYAGYRPEMARGVAISRKTLPPTHPMMTTSQAMTCRYAQDRK